MAKPKKHKGKKRKDKELKRARDRKDAKKVKKEAKRAKKLAAPSPQTPTDSPDAGAGDASTTGSAAVTASPEKTPKKIDSDKAIPASNAVRAEWARRVEAEYRSAAITQHLTLWLIQMGASPDLIHDGLRIVADELAHAELSHGAFVAAGGGQIPPIARESLQLRIGKDEPLEVGVTRFGVEVFCLGETVAVPLFKVLREKCVVPSARDCLDRVLKDEVRHRDFGWALLEWLLQMPCEPLVRKLVNRELPGMFTRIRRNYAPVGGEKKKRIPPDDRAWGLMPIARYADILERTVERDYRPRFTRLGFDIDAAWDEAVKARPTVGS